MGTFFTDGDRKQRTISSYGSFTFEHCVDLTGGVIIHPPKEYNDEMLAKAMTRFIGMFAVQTLPHLNGFSGFDTIQFEIKK